MRLVPLSVALACCPLVTSAHHASNVGYDWDNITELEGEITAVIWRNPHVRIDLSRVGEDGEEEHWELESAGINIVQRLGVSSGDINVGDRVRVAGAPNRLGETKMFIANALLPDGREVLLRASAEPRWTSSSADLSVIFGDVNGPKLCLDTAGKQTRDVRVQVGLRLGDIQRLERGHATAAKSPW